MEINIEKLNDKLLARMGVEKARTGYYSIRVDGRDIVLEANFTDTKRLETMDDLFTAIYYAGQREIQNTIKYTLGIFDEPDEDFLNDE